MSVNQIDHYQNSEQPQGFIKNLSLPYLALTLAILATSLSAMFVRWADAPGPVTVFYRSLIAAILFLPVFVRNLIVRKYERSRFLSMLPVGLLGGVMITLDQSAWSTSVILTKVANATYFNSLAPLWVALFALVFFKESLPFKFWIGLTSTMAGVLLILGLDFLRQPQMGTGDLLGVLSSIFFGGYFIVTQIGRRYFDALTYTWLATASCAAGLLVVNTMFSYPLTGYPQSTYWVFLGAALVNQMIGYFAMTYALGHLPASVVSPSTLAKPVITALLAIPLFGEKLSLVEIIGGIMVVVGIYFVNRSRSMNGK
jgi:drug/metabolite transporter (DMT)-like permease